MRYKLYNQTIPFYSAVQQILFNRGIQQSDMYHYMHTTDEDINDYNLFGDVYLRSAAIQLTTAIKNNEKIIVVVDCDADGYTSSALLISYLHDIFPQFVENNIDWFMHQGKQHGLNDCIDYILQKDYKLVIVPDAGSNDYSAHARLTQNGAYCIILDHHEADRVSDNAIVINNQLSDYPNKDLSGVGVVYQFCRYMEQFYGGSANKYLDLVMLGLTADMMSLKSIETKHLINKGLMHIRNPFIKEMTKKNAFSLGANITSWGVAFYVAPYVNAIVRSGTMEQKELVFTSMLDFKGSQIVPSTKRGHFFNETETRAEQAVRTACNVKSRQTKSQDAGMARLEARIKDEDMLSHKSLVFLLDEDDNIDDNIRGLVANKLMGKYNKPCFVLTKSDDGYAGSVRGCDKTGVSDFKDICEDTECCDYATGHQGAFGVKVAADNVSTLIEKIDKTLANVKDENFYLVDYIYHVNDLNPETIFEIASCADLWGKDMPESLIAITHVKVKKDNICLMGVEKGRPTIKIILPNNITCIKFGATQEQYYSLLSNGYVELEIVGKCAKNEWNGNVTPQVMITDYEITDRVEGYF